MPSHGVTTTALTADNLIAGAFPRVTKTITIVSGAGVLVRGTVLGKVTASGKYKAYNNGASTGEEQARGLLVADVDATSEDVVAEMYVTGEFNATAVTGEDAAGIADLEALNLYIK